MALIQEGKNYIKNSLLKAVFRIRIWIRMDPGFFADPDPGYKSPDPDPSISKLIGSKW